MKHFDRASRAFSDLIGLFVFPMFVAMLPWPIGLRALRWAARRMRPFRAEADAAWHLASRYVTAADVDAWKTRYRLIRWVERADTFLTLTRSTRWWRRHVDVEGDWPEGGRASLLLTFHWGAGNWIWKLLRERGLHAYFLARRPVTSDLGASRIALGYAALRAWALRRVGSRGPLYTGGSVERIRAAWRQGDRVVAMLDLPAPASLARQRVVLLDRPAELPSRLAELAIASEARVVLFSCGFDPLEGRRRLRLETLPTSTNAAVLVDRYARHLDACLRSTPEFWLMWHEAQAIFLGAGHTMAVPELHARVDS